MSAETIKVGDEKILNRPTFLFQGIFVNQGIQVKIMEVTDGEDDIIVQFLDREGFPHILKGVKSEELI